MMEQGITEYLLIGQLCMLAGIFFRMGGVKEAITDIKRRLDVLEQHIFPTSTQRSNHVK